ncbi:MAG: tetratricopeptide repeat protein [Bacteroidota bacterium]
MKVGFFAVFLCLSLGISAQNKSGSDTLYIKSLHEKITGIWLSNPDQALDFADVALEKSQQISDSAFISKSLRLIAGVYYYKGEYNSSLDFNFQALQIANHLEDSALINNGYNNIGLLYYNLGNYQAALEYLLRAKTIKDAIGETYGKPLTLANIGKVYLKNDSLQKARKYFRQSFKLSQDLQDEGYSIYAFNHLGESFVCENNLDSALFYYSKAHLIAQKIDNENWGASSLRGLGQVSARRGQYNSARYYLTAGLDGSRQVQDQGGIAKSFYLLAMLEIEQQDYIAAKQYLEQSQQVALRIKQRHQIFDNLKLCVELYKKLGDADKVIDYQNEYIQFRDSVHSLIIASNLTAVPDKLENERQRDLFVQERSQLESQKNINRLYGSILILLVPLVAFLIYLLNRNSKAARKLRENNEELIETQQLLVTSEKMASLGVLAAGVGHEINNPLNFIKNGVEALLSTIREKKSITYEESEQYFQIIGEGVNRATTIVKSLSHFSRKGANTNEKCDIHSIVENCLLILHNKIKNRIRIVTNFTAQGAHLRGNEGRLHQVMMNIISNAEQAIPEKGTIEITTINRKDTIAIKIKDDGEGIEKENLDKVSDPFFTTKPPGVGTGLGLFITFSIIDEHNGKIDIDSEKGVGTEFTIELPKKQKKDGQ